MKASSRTVGILGGMGPYATQAFYQMILDMTPVTKDWDHLRVIIDVNPHIPSRSRHYMYAEPSPVQGMIDSCRRLERYPVDFIVIPCNSASHFLPEVQAAIKIPIINIMKVTADALPIRLPDAKRIGVLGGIITYEKRMYEPYLAAHGLSYIHHSEDVQRRIEYLIEKIKINVPKEEATEELVGLVHYFCTQLVVDAVVLGCTEFGCLGDVIADIPMVDSSRELAYATVKNALE